MHWCDFCKTNHSSMSCYHPGNPKNRGNYPVNDDDVKADTVPRSRYDAQESELRALEKKHEKVVANAKAHIEATEARAQGLAERAVSAESKLSACQLELEAAKRERDTVALVGGKALTELHDVVGRLGRSEKLLGMVYTAMTTHGVLPWMRSQVEEWFKVETGEHRCTVWNAEGICDICGTNGRIVERHETK